MRKGQDIGKFILRVSLGGMFFMHGIGKIQNGIGGIEKLLIAKNIPEILAYGVFIGEIIAPIFMIIGFRTKIAALIIAATMAVAVWLAHYQDIYHLNNNGGWGVELQALYFFGAIAIFFLGGGKHGVSSKSSLD
jgi:putative oxidoreductase